MLSADPKVKKDEAGQMMKNVFWPSGYDDEYEL